MHSKETYNRQTDLDLLCGILIIHMIITHLATWAGLAYRGDRILFFFMPWFFFKSGMFFRKSEPVNQVRKDARHLLLPFVAFSAIGHLFYCIDLAVCGDTDFLHYVSFPKYLLLYGAIPANPALWFLLSLFIVKSVYNAVSGIIDSRLIMLVALAVAFVHSYFVGPLFVYIGNSALGLLFYALGAELNKRQYEPRWLILSILVYVIAVFFPSRINMYHNELFRGNYFLAVLYSLAGIVFFNNISRFLVAPPPTQKFIHYQNVK